MGLHHHLMFAAACDRGQSYVGQPAEDLVMSAAD